MEIFFAGLLLLLVAYAILIRRFYVAWKEIPSGNGSSQPAHPVRVSVIIPARNEASHIGACLDALLRQQYPKELLEIIVVNDFSTDETKAIVKNYAASGVILLNLQDLISSDSTIAFKKKALAAGIAKAGGSFILTTDADCIAPVDWVKIMVQTGSKSKAVFVAAPVRIATGRSFVAVFETLDFLSLQGITAAAVAKDLFPMCNGANLGYDRDAFYAVDGFAGIDQIASGDDMLLLGKIRHRFPGRVAYAKNTGAIVQTGAAAGWRSFFRQRIRWASKMGHYKDRPIFFTLLLVYAVNAGMLIFFMAACISPSWVWAALLLLLIKTVVEFPFVQSVAVFFGQRSLLKYFPLCQPLHIIYTVIAGAFGKFGHYRWKDRRVK